MTHTPGPWITKPMWCAEAHWNLFHIVTPKPTTRLEKRLDSNNGGGFSEADAKHIVHCVNTHEALVEALQELIEEISICQECGSLTDKHFITGNPLSNAKKALAAAKGGV